jgi:hypothetical protein
MICAYVGRIEPALDSVQYRAFVPRPMESVYHDIIAAYFVLFIHLT